RLGYRRTQRHWWGGVAGRAFRGDGIQRHGRGQSGNRELPVRYRGTERDIEWPPERDRRRHAADEPIPGGGPVDGEPGPASPEVVARSRDVADSSNRNGDRVAEDEPLARARPEQGELIFPHPIVVAGDGDVRCRAEGDRLGMALNPPLP